MIDGNPELGGLHPTRSQRDHGNLTVPSASEIRCATTVGSGSRGSQPPGELGACSRADFTAAARQGNAAAS
ncbi:MAG TPA: hypothetical protein VK784_04390 [Pseudonocardiaceae bacterium]|nr:hypothetical protein [Pseudonocardiaceae bacterium]